MKPIASLTPASVVQKTGATVTATTALAESVNYRNGIDAEILHAAKGNMIVLSAGVYREYPATTFAAMFTP